MADNVTLPRVGGTFISRMKEVASGIFSAVPLIGDPATGDPLSKGRKDAADTLSFSLDNESKAVLDDLKTAMEALAAVIPGLGAKATADPLEPSEGTENLPLSTNLYQALRTTLTHADTGAEVDFSLASGVFFDSPGPQAPRLAMATNTNAQPLLAAGGAGVYYDLVGWKAYNPAGGSTVVVQIIDDQAGANTIVDEMVLAAGQQDSSGCLAVPTRQLAANKAWSVKLSGAVAGVIVKAWFTTRTDA